MCCRCIVPASRQKQQRRHGRWTASTALIVVTSGSWQRGAALRSAACVVYCCCSSCAIDVRAVTRTTVCTRMIWTREIVTHLQRPRTVSYKLDLLYMIYNFKLNLFENRNIAYSINMHTLGPVLGKLKHTIRGQASYRHASRCLKVVTH